MTASTATTEIMVFTNPDYGPSRRMTETIDDLADERPDIRVVEVDVWHNPDTELEYGKILRRSGEPDRAGVVLREALDQPTRSGDERCSVRAMTALGTSLRQAGDAAGAAELLREGLRRGRDLDEKHTSRVALSGLAILMIETEQESDAVVLLSFVDRLGQTLAVPVSQSSQAKREARLAALREQVGSMSSIACGKKVRR